jgi:hypothetical protein
MKTRHSYLSTAILAGLMVLRTLSGALAQPSPDTHPSPTGTNTAKADTFVFDGGDPRDFLVAVEKHFNVDWRSIAEIPDQMKYAVRIPKLRVPWQQQIHKDRPAEAENVTALITLYNRLAEHRPELGTLVVEGDPLKPSAVMFVPDKTSRNAQSTFKVRAFSLGRIPESDWAKLRHDIAEAYSRAMEFALQTGAALAMQGSVSIHEDTRLIVATGSEIYVDMVGSIVEAHNASSKVRSLPPDKN